ncbi:hypothetical protein NBRC116589_13750 [Ruegeria sp. HU-ET01832]
MYVLIAATNFAMRFRDKAAAVAQPMNVTEKEREHICDLRCALDPDLVGTHKLPELVR